jgi:hypothetical protein
MGYRESLRAARAEIQARERAVKRLREAYWAGTVLRADAEPVLKTLVFGWATPAWWHAFAFPSQAKIRQAIKAAEWLADPKREILTPAVEQRVASGRPRYLTPPEVLQLHS